MTLPRPSRSAPLLAGLAAGAILAGAGLGLAVEVPRSALPHGASGTREVPLPPTGSLGPRVSAPPSVDVVPQPLPATPERTTEDAAPGAEPSTLAQPSTPPKTAPTETTAPTGRTAPTEARRPRAAPAPAQASARPTRRALVDTIAAVVAATNTERVAAGCRALRVDDRINTAAQRHSVDMANRSTMSHIGRDGSRFTDRLQATGYPRPGAENVAFGQPTAASVVAAWMASSGHRRNILNCAYTAIGVGYDPRGNYWTQNFGY